MELSDACARFLEHCRLEKGLSAHTLRAYRADLKEFQKVTIVEHVEDVGSGHLKSYLAYLRDTRGLKPATAKRRFATLKAMLGYLELEEMISENPFRIFRFSLRLGRKLPRNLTKGELQGLKAGIAKLPLERRKQRIANDFVGETVDLAIRMLLVTGIRVGELCTICLPDIDLRDASIRIRGKGNRERRVFLITEDLRELVQQYIFNRSAVSSAQSHDLLLINSRGAPATPDYIRKHLREKAAALGIERRITPHMLRHTAATEYLEKGVDIRYVQRLLGHASIATTEIYAAATDEGLRKALTR